jgi:hypothetical protein
MRSTLNEKCTHNSIDVLNQWTRAFETPQNRRHVTEGPADMLVCRSITDSRVWHLSALQLWRNWTDKLSTCGVYVDASSKYIMRSTLFWGLEQGGVQARPRIRLQKMVFAPCKTAADQRGRPTVPSAAVDQRGSFSATLSVFRLQMNLPVGLSIMYQCFCAFESISD